MGNQSTVTVSTELGDVICHKMVFADYAQLLRVLDKAPKLIGDILFKDSKDSKAQQGIDQAKIIANLPLIASESLPEIAAVIASATDKDGEFISKLDPVDVINIADGILTVNDFNRVVEAVKKLMAHRAKVTPARASEKVST